MKLKSEKSIELYHMMLRRGYLSHYKKLPLEEVADEMLAILSERSRIMQKKELASVNTRWNEYLNRGIGE
jgi:hypothetical protein